MVTRLDLENNASLKRIAHALEEIVKLLTALVETQTKKEEEDSDVHA